MNRILKNAVALLIVANGISLLTASANAQTSWRSVTDAGGFSWARIKFVNNATTPQSWSVWNCRTAVSSTDSTATTDAVSDWDGQVAAGATQYVWVYSVPLGEVNYGSAGSTDNGLQATGTPVDGADGELVITLAADGTPSVTVVTGATYIAPSHTGSLPDLSVE